MKKLLTNVYSWFVGYPSRYNYWSCTNTTAVIQRWVGMTKKPIAATSVGWRQWKSTNERTHPIWYWITEEGVDVAQDIIYFPYDVYLHIVDQISCRFISETHKISTSLAPGIWYTNDDKMLSGLYHMVIDVVENDRADQYRVVSSTAKSGLNGRTAGLAQLDWEISLGDESAHQANSALEIKDIYLWIVDTRPNRPDPWESVNIPDTQWDDMEQSQHTRDTIQTIWNMEQQQIDEDTEMLKRIIAIRQYL